MINLYDKNGHYSSLRDWTDILMTIGLYLGGFFLLLILVKLG
jgi:hypothetical protein